MALAQFFRKHSVAYFFGVSKTKTKYPWIYRDLSGWDTEQKIGTDPDSRLALVKIDATGNALTIWREQNGGGQYDVAYRYYDVGSGWSDSFIGVVDVDDTYSVPANYYGLAMNDNGIAYIVWAQRLTGEAQFSIFSRRFTATGGGLESIVRLETSDAEGCSYPSVAVSPTGVAGAVWKRSGSSTLWGAIQDHHSSWGPETAVEVTGATVSIPVIAADSRNNFTVAYAKQVSSVWSAYSNHYTQGYGWNSAVAVDEESGYAYQADLTILPDNSAMLAWDQPLGGEDRALVRQYLPAKSWDAITTIESSNDGDAEDPQVIFTDKGEGLAVWAQQGSSRKDIWANRYTMATGWGTAQLLENSDSGDTKEVSLASDASGNAIAVWLQHNGTTNDAWYAKYNPSTGWSAAVLLESGVGEARTPTIALAKDGSGLAAWAQSDGSVFHLWSRAYAPANGFAAAALIEEENGYDAADLDLALSNNGDAMAVWSQASATVSSIYAAHYTKANGWAASVLLEDYDGGAATLPQIAFNGGDAIAVWQHADGSNLQHIRSNRFSSGSWSANGLIETDNNGDAVKPQIAIDQSGDAIVLWTQPEQSYKSIWYNHYQVGSGWNASGTVLETDDSGDATAPMLAVDLDGNYTAIWQQSDGSTTNIWSNLYTNGDDWETPRLREIDDTHAAEAPSVAYDSLGNAIYIWRQHNGGQFDILSSVFH